jgi:adenosylcobinamide-GDP ribazoletransferase
VSAARSPITALGEAVRFLTVLRWPGSPSSDPARLAQAAAAFPAAGLLVGAVSVGAGMAAERLFGSPFAAVAAVAASAVVTGGLHLDGLADSCDALFSWRSREQKLEILRDSRIGTMGALALFFALAVKVAALTALGPLWWRAALIAPMWGRWSVVYGMARFPPARPDGLGASARAHLRASDFVWTTGLALLVGFGLLPPWGGLLGLVVLAAAWLMGRAMAQSLGGLTGDTYGALAEVAEGTTFLTLVALRHWAWIA